MHHVPTGWTVVPELVARLNNEAKGFAGCTHNSRKHHRIVTACCILRVVDNVAVLGTYTTRNNMYREWAAGSDVIYRSVPEVDRQQKRATCGGHEVHNMGSIKLSSLSARLEEDAANRGITVHVLCAQCRVLEFVAQEDAQLPAMQTMLFMRCPTQQQQQR